MTCLSCLTLLPLFPVVDDSRLTLFSFAFSASRRATLARSSSSVSGEREMTVRFLLSPDVEAIGAR